MKKENQIRDKSFAFAIRVVKAYKYLNAEHKEFVMSKQLLRSGTAVGALYREAEHAESKADFIHKLGIAQKECNETIYWLDLLHETEFFGKDAYDSLQSDATELMKLLTTIIKSSKKSINH